jgi:hypothetical protein
LPDEPENLSDRGAVDPSGIDQGSATLTLYDVPPDAVGSGHAGRAARQRCGRIGSLFEEDRGR